MLTSLYLCHDNIEAYFFCEINSSSGLIVLTGQLKGLLFLSVSENEEMCDKGNSPSAFQARGAPK